MRSVRMFFLVLVLGVTPCARAAISGVEKLGGTFEIQGSMDIRWEFPDDPPDYSGFFHVVQGAPVSDSLESPWYEPVWGRPTVYCAAGYDRVVAFNTGFAPTRWYYVRQYASSDYLFRPLYSCAYDVAFDGVLFNILTGGDRLRLYFADTTTGEVLIDVDGSFHQVLWDSNPYPWTETYTETFRFQLLDSHTYNLEVLVQPFGRSGPDARGTGEMNISVTPVPAPGAALLGVIGAALVAHLRKRRTL